MVTLLDSNGADWLVFVQNYQPKCSLQGMLGHHVACHTIFLEGQCSPEEVREMQVINHQQHLLIAQSTELNQIMQSPGLGNCHKVK